MATCKHRARAIALLSLLLAFLAACDEIHLVSHSGAGAYEASLTPMPGGFVAGWYDTKDGNPEIYFRLLDAEGRPRGPEHRATRDPEFSYEADVAWADGNVAIAWYGRSDNGSLRAHLGMWSTGGELMWSKTVSSATRDGRNILVRATAGELFCAWIEDVGDGVAELWTQRWSPRGEPLAAAQRMAPASRNTWNLNAAVDADGESWVVFDAKAGTRAEELFLLRAGPKETTLVQLSPDDGFPSKYPDLDLSADRAALTWFDEKDGNKEVYLFVGDKAALGDSISSKAARVTNTRGESIGAYVSWNGDRAGLAWCDNSEGQHEIYFQDFAANGSPLRASSRLTRTPTQSLIPAIVPAGDLFALVWNEYHAAGPGHTQGGRSEIAFALAR